MLILYSIVGTQFCTAVYGREEFRNLRAGLGGTWDGFRDVCDGGLCGCF